MNWDKMRWTRRTLLTTSTIMAGGMLVRPSLLQAVQAVSAPFDLVKISGDSKIISLVSRAMEALGGIGRFISRGDVVVVKPNIGWDRVPEQAATTNPELVAWIVSACVQAGAKRVHVFDHTCNDARRCYLRSGIQAAAKEAGARVSYIDSRKFVDVQIKDGKFLRSWPLYREILEADKLINLPIAKHHGLAGYTLSLKNWMGIIGGRRGKFHQDLTNSLVDLMSVCRPVLTVLDGYRILLRNGPQGGSINDVGHPRTVIAGIDQLAVDALAVPLFGTQAQMPLYLAEAESRGFGKTSVSSERYFESRVVSAA